MASKLQLESELAQVEFDERQLQLERRKLELRYRLAQFGNMDLDQSETQGSDRPQLRSEPEDQNSTRHSSPAEPFGIANGSNLDEEEVASQGSHTMSPEQPQEKISSNARATDTDSSIAVKDLAQQAANDVEPDHSLTTAKRARPAVPINHDDNDASLLASFTRSVSPSVVNTLLRNTRAHSEEVNSINPASQLKNPKSRNASGLESPTGVAHRTKRRRSSRTEDKSLDKVNTDMTRSEHLDLIHCYWDLFIKHMQEFEESNTNTKAGIRHTVASRMRKLNVGRTHPSLTHLHDEYATIVQDHSPNEEISRELDTELEKFVAALPYWSPFVKTMPEQAHRLAKVTTLFHMIAENEFDFEHYHEYFDLCNVL